MFAGVDSFPMMAIPFFMLAGALMDTGGISSRLVRFSNYLVGWIPGGLAHVAIVASMFFAGITGSAVADATAIGSTLIPLMNKRGFPKLFSASVVAAAGVVGPIIPPSIPMVIYGVMAGVSIGAMFIGGFIPGLLIGLALMLVAYVKAKRHGYPREAVRPTLREFLEATVSASGAIFMPLIILVGIFGGSVHRDRSRGGGDGVRVHDGEVRVQRAAVAPLPPSSTGRAEHRHDPHHRGCGESGRLHHGGRADSAAGGGAVPERHRPTST